MKAPTKKKVRKAPSVDTLRRLFALSGNQCARPGCRTVLLSAKGVLVGEVAHIAAESPGGPRFDPKLTEEERRGFNNLLLLCATCHSLVDKDPDSYPRPMVRKWKRDREARFEAVGDLLRKAYLDEITDEADSIGLSLPKSLAGFTTYYADRGETAFIDSDTPEEVAAYVERLRHLSMPDRQLMLAIIEKTIALGGAREDENGITVHPDDLKTIVVNGKRLSDYRIDKLGQTLDRNGLGSVDSDGYQARVSIPSMHIDMNWSELKAFAETKNTTLSAFLVDLKFGLLD